MGTIIKIAIRNLKEHKAKSLIVGILISVGILVMVLSNSILDTAQEGSKKVFIDNYTGHLMVSKKLKKGTMTTFGLEGAKTKKSPIVPNYKKVYEYLNSIPEVTAVNSQTAGLSALIKFNENMDEFAFTREWGIDPDSYLKMFPDNIEMFDGRFLKSGEHGVLLSRKLIDDVKNDLGYDLKVGDMITFQTFTSGFKILEVPLRGIYKYKNGNATAVQMNLMDIESYRTLARMTVGTTDTVKIDDKDQELLNEDFDFDTMLFDDVDVDATTDSINFDSVLGDLSERNAMTKPSTGTWNFILLKLKNMNQIEKVKSDIETWAKENDVNIEVKTWKKAAGNTGKTIEAVKIIFNVFIIIIAIVTVIIIMNTLVVSIIERTPEIGTMRAVGAQKSFVRKLFITETLTISVVFGLIGLILGLISLFVLNKVGISFHGNLYIELIFGAEALYPVTTFLTIIKALVVTVGIGVLASLYPVSVALRIEPIKAIQN